MENESAMAAVLPNSILNDASILSLRCFAAVVETQSFSSAARQLRLAPSSVTKHVQLIENALNVALLHRTTRDVRAIFRLSSQRLRAMVRLVSKPNGRIGRSMTATAPASRTN